MLLTISLVIVDTRSSSFEAPQQGEVAGQTARCLFRRLDCVERSGSDISRTLSFCFPNVIELVQRIVRFVMRTEPKASYRTVQCKYTYRYTSNIYIYIYIHFYFRLIILLKSFYFIMFKVTFISSNVWSYFQLTIITLDPCHDISWCFRSEPERCTCIQSEWRMAEYACAHNMRWWIVGVFLHLLRRPSIAAV